MPAYRGATTGRRSGDMPFPYVANHARPLLLAIERGDRASYDLAAAGLARQGWKLARIDDDTTTELEEHDQR